ncbi:extracellular solute-binding protein [Demequina sp.]|uniref:ABC transporter substrate-binding protein n=1 Tax=Demequina sp. TaxID=2050685 RepID=UPI0025BC6C5C|nr:extracellular solute-binding protein [Demequina sp.]
MTLKYRKAARVLAAVAGSSLILAACGLLGDDDSPATTTAGPVADPVTISMSFWGDFGLDALAAEYEETHPGVTVELISGNYNDLHDELQRQIVAGTGAPSIVAIGEDYIGKFASQPDAFVDLNSFDADTYEEYYLEWKWAQGSTPDGSQLIGMGADVSGLALCFRRDLFENAGLPSNRDAVERAIGDTWEGFVALGKQYQEATETGAFLDDAGSLLKPVRAQSGASYFNAEGALALEPVKPAFDVALSTIDAGLSAGIMPFTDEWDAGLDSGTFAATLCPVWGMGYIQSVQETAGGNAKWDIADIPGPGGSWGGAFYAIPDQGTAAQQEQAWEFVNWLIQPDQQLRIFHATGSLPSQPALYTDESVESYVIPFFNDAPVGPILAKAVTELPTQSLYSPNNGTVDAILQEVLGEVQEGNVGSADAWTVATEAAALAVPAPPTPEAEAE